MANNRGDRILVQVSLNGQRLSRVVSSESEATQVRAQLRAQLSATAETSRVWRLQEAATKALQSRWRTAKSQQTIQKVLKSVLGHFGADLQLDQIDAPAIDDWQEHLEALGNSNATLNRKLACLSVLLRTAHELGGLPILPPLSRFRKKEGIGRVRWLSEAEEAACSATLTAWSRLDELDLFRVLIDSGLRYSEATQSLKAQDVNLQTGLMTVWETKTGKPRSVPMTSRVREVLSRWSARHPSGPVMPIPHANFWHLWNRMRTHLSLDADCQFVPHALRHTCMSRLAQAGVPLQAIREWGGWSSFAMVMRYAHLSPKHLTPHVGALEVYSKGIASPEVAL